MCKPGITGKGVHFLVSHLKQALSTISELSIVYINDIQSVEDGLLHIAEALQTNSHLTKLKIHDVNLNCSIENGSALTEMLNRNNTLTHLDLSYNRLSDLGAHCIFQGLQQNTTLIYLNLHNNGITSCEGTAQALKKLLQTNKTLIHLDLSENQIFSNSSSRCILLEGFQLNTTLVHLNLANTGISVTEDTIHAFSTMLQASLTHLDLSQNVYFPSTTRYSNFPKATIIIKNICI